ncbi:MAG: hypothetical protein HY718_13120 [Planctomycetes bacterium]|nr:hypothetical protein [Planctomycetota bacterium]
MTTLQTKTEPDLGHRFRPTDRGAIAFFVPACGNRTEQTALSHEKLKKAHRGLRPQPKDARHGR